MTLRARLVGGTILLVAVLSGAVIGIMRAALAERLEAELRLRGVAIAKYVAADAVAPIIGEDFVGLQLVLVSALRLEDDIAYFFVQDPAGEVLAHTFGEGFPVALRDANRWRADGEPGVVLLEAGGEELYDVALPLVKGQLGAVRVGMRREPVQDTVHRFIAIGGLITVACLVVFGGIALAVEVGIARDIAALAEGAGALGIGDLEHRVPVHGGRELADLARAFNAMADNLQRSEEKLVDLNTTLLREVRDRKAAEERLRGASTELARQNEELKKLDRLREGFIRDVSHELKTPVAKHAMQLEILRGIAARGGFAAQVERVVAVMEGSVRRQQKVIKNLLGMARLEAGARGYRREPVDLAAVLRGVAEDYEPELSARGIRLDLDLAPVTVVGDGEMLWHVFSNLVNNAIKFQTSADGGAIAVSAAVEGGAAVVRVRDEGIGLEPDELERVFEKFYQGTASTEGAGVGLTICRMIVEGLGGRIRFESAGRGRGATAVVELPAGAPG